MRYYIFKSKKEKGRFNVNSDAIAISEDLDYIVETFEKVVKSYQYDHCYLVCDFADVKHSMFKTYKITPSDVPFLIIGEYHWIYGDNFDIIYRHDSIMINATGFTQLFEDNLNAIRAYKKYIKAGNKAELILLYQYFDDGIIMHDNQLLSTSIQVIRGKGTPIRRIEVDNHSWMMTDRDQWNRINNTMVNYDEVLLDENTDQSE